MAPGHLCSASAQSLFWTLTGTLSHALRLFLSNQVEEKAKFDGIFESLLPINGLLSGDKVKPVLMNSKLPLDVLGRVSGALASCTVLSLVGPGLAPHSHL